VLIQGAAGGVGLAAVQLAKRAGARVIGTGSSPEQLAKLRGFGLDVGVDYTSEDVAAQVRALTDGRGVDVVIDPVGGASLQKSVDCLGVDGRAILIGLMDQSPSEPSEGLR
jgi:NADPH2:quinone reductase